MTCPTATYLSADVTVDVSGAQDAEGNAQQDYTAQVEFAIDTLNPTVNDVTASDRSITDATAGTGRSR